MASPSEGARNRNGHAVAEALIPPDTADADPHPPRVAILPWGDYIEDYLDAIGLSVEDFATRMAGGWLFGYADALRSAGVECLVLCFSRDAVHPYTLIHPDTGLRTRILPAPRTYRWLRARMRDPYAWTVDGAVGSLGGFRRLFWKCVRPWVPYLATPPLRLARELRSTPCRALLCQEYESPRFDVAVMVGRALGVPVFGSFQGGTWHASRLESMVRPLSVRAAAGLVVGPSRERERVSLEYRIPESSIAAVFNPLDPEQWRDDAHRAEVRAELGLLGDARVAIWHGRVEMERKGLDVLMRAWRSVAETDAGGVYHLVLVGSGADDNQLEAAIAELGRVRSSVTWVREFVLDRARVRSLLSAADVYVFPSRHEGFAVAPLEAMAAGLPLVAADASGISDALPLGRDSGGLTVPRGDADALAEALRELLANPHEALALGERAAARVREAFSPGVVGAALAAFLLPEARPVSTRR